MPWSVAAVLLGVFVSVAAFGSWRLSKPADPLNPRLAPWRTICVAAGLGAVLMLLHLADLAGIRPAAN